MGTNAEIKKAFKLTEEQTRYEEERFSAQIAFAEFVCAQNKTKAAQWKKLISKAKALVNDAAKAGDLKKIKKAVADAEKLMAPIGKKAKDYTLYCVGHAHIDMNWMWSWPETVGLTTDTFNTVLKLMDEFPEFIFSQSQASVYRIVEEFDPAMLKQIKKRIKQGRWEVTASHWVEGDKNLAGGESLCRHLLYTRRYMQKLFGLTADDIQIDWTPDTFGHAATVPTYLVQGGVKYGYMHRPGVHTALQPRPRAFQWEGPDGSRVLIHNDMHLGYNGAINPDIVTNALQPFVEETGAPFALYVYGVGDHGGGPTRQDLYRLRDMMSWPIYPTLQPAASCDYFKRLETIQNKLPIIKDELNFEFTGCYTTQTLIKRANRLGEKVLADAETAAALTNRICNTDYKRTAFEEGWRDILFNHFHDILPGSGVRDTRTYSHGLFQKTAAMTSMAEKNSLRALAAEIDTSHAAGTVDPDLPPAAYPRGLGGGIGMNTVEGGFSSYGPGIGSDKRPYVIFNNQGFQRNEIVEAVLWDPAWGVEDDSQGYIAAGPDGKECAAQVIEKGNYWGHTFVRIAFPVSVPALGYALYTISRGTASPVKAKSRQTGTSHVCAYASIERGQEGLANDLIEMTVDPQTGGIQELIDKRNKAVLISSDGSPAGLQIGLERPRGMSAWEIEHTGGWETPEVTWIGRKAQGPYCSSLQVDLRKGQSEFTLIYTVKAGDPRVYIDFKALWCEKGSKAIGTPVLRYSLPLNLTRTAADYEIPFGSIRRDIGEGAEVPALRWAALSGTVNGAKAGCLLLNDSKYGYAHEDSTLHLTLIRSSFEPDVLPEAGEHTVGLALEPISGFNAAAAIREGKQFNHELKVVATDAHNGELPAQMAGIKNDTKGIHIESIKLAEDDDSLIIRLFSTLSRKAEAKITLHKAIGARIKGGLVNVLEEPLKKNEAMVKGRSITVPIPAKGLVNLKVTLAQ